MAVAGARLVDSLEDLLAQDERLLEPLAQRHFSAGDWAVVRELEDGVGWELIRAPAAAALAEFLTAGAGLGERRWGHTRAMDSRSLSETLVETRRVMTQEARFIVDAARRRGVVLRLFGGLAVHEHCAGLAACLRDHSDVDLVGLSRQTVPMIEVFGELGFRERPHVRAATARGQAQFVRDCVHVDPTGAHPRTPTTTWTSSSIASSWIT